MGKFSLIRVKKIATSLLVIGSLFFCSSTTSFAYSTETHQLTGDMYWVVDNDQAGQSTASVTLYMYVQPDSSYETARSCYEFFCNEGVFDYGDNYVETDAPMQYWFYTQNRRVTDHIGDGEVWYWQFGLQPGKYTFAEPDGLSNFFVLTSALGSPFMEDGYTTADTVVVNDEPIRLYALYGDYEWAKENVQDMVEWAKTTEANLNKGHTSLEENVNTIEVKGSETEQPKLDSADLANEAQKNDAEGEEQIADKEHTMVEAESVSDNDSFKENLKYVLKTAPFVIVLTVVLFVIKKKDEKGDN